jgi:CPA2 family monovalent cation:H+ antiporter-2/glutathione-regulated potassium-efflux system protein KefB
VSERELFVVAGLFTVVASAAVMHTLGLSTALGAFIAGVMLADSPLPARAGGGHRPVPVDPARAVLHRRGHEPGPGVIADRPLMIVAMASLWWP